MKKAELTAAVQAAKAQTREALETMFAEMNHGQQQKMIKNETVKTLFDRFDVAYQEEI